MLAEGHRDNMRQPLFVVAKVKHRRHGKRNVGQPLFATA